MKPIGKVTHYYGKLGVAIVELKDKLAVGDRVRFERGEHSFDQEVTSMEEDYKSVEKAGSGASVGIKVKEKVHEGALVLLDN
ncbi:MAG: U32 family peptidase C-terminal domain-containing protein [Candidatus Yanofskybacteria bacterium]|nr:U32 family peptidase C-terminal domain-containing protein [Candidatus Yanofskybacteria bacterium]